MCGDWQLASDHVQEALIRVYRHWPRLRSDARGSAYARKAVVSVVIDAKRRAVEHRGAGRLRGRRDSAATTRPTGVPTATCSAGAWPRCRPRQRACLVLRYYDDLSVSEVAAVLGCSEGTVKSQTARGLETLQAAFARETERRSAREREGVTMPRNLTDLMERRGVRRAARAAPRRRHHPARRAPPATSYDGHRRPVAALAVVAAGGAGYGLTRGHDHHPRAGRLPTCTTRPSTRARTRCRRALCPGYRGSSPGRCPRCSTSADGRGPAATYADIDAERTADRQGLPGAGADAAPRDPAVRRSRTAARLALTTPPSPGATTPAPRSPGSRPVQTDGRLLWNSVRTRSFGGVEHRIPRDRSRRWSRRSSSIRMSRSGTDGVRRLRWLDLRRPTCGSPPSDSGDRRGPRLALPLHRLASQDL